MKKALQTIWTNFKNGDVPTVMIVALAIVSVGLLVMPEIAAAFNPGATCTDGGYGLNASATGDAFQKVYCTMYNLLSGPIGATIGLALIGFGVYQAGFGNGGLAVAIPSFFAAAILILAPSIASLLGVMLW